MAKKIQNPESSEPSTTDVVAESPVVDEVAVVKTPTPDAIVSDKFDEIHKKVNDLATTLRDLQLHLKSVQKELVKLVKANVKKSKTRGTGGANKTPSGFAKPTKLSDALCDFLQVPHGTEFARTDVTRRINAYIKEKSLQDEKDKRIIHPDTELAKVLTYDPAKPLTYFSLQSSLRTNFIKTP